MLVVVLFVGYALQQHHLSARFEKSADTVAPAAAPSAPADRPPARQEAARSAAAQAPAPPTTAAPAQTGAPAAAAPAAPQGRGGLLGDEEVPRPAEQLNSLGKLGDKDKGYPVRLDDESVRRDHAGGEVAGDSASNVARAVDGVPALRQGAGLSGTLGGAGAGRGSNAPAEKPAVQGKGEAARGPAFARPPAGPQKQAPYGEAPAPVVEERRPAPAAPSPPAAAQAPAARPMPAPNAAFDLREGNRQPAAPKAGRSLKSQVNNVEAEAAPAAPSQAQAQPQGLGRGAQPADGHGLAPADAEYQSAMGADCGRQIGLLTDFLRKYPNDNRAEAARARIAVCRAQLTGKSDDLDQVLSRQRRMKMPSQQRAAKPSAKAAEVQQRAAKAPPKPAAGQKSDKRAAEAKKAKAAAKPAKKAADTPRQTTK
jgi:hypothetical protein